MKNYESIRNEEGRRILIAAHRGVYGGNIPCNTLAAFEVALRQGADIIECDVAKSLDNQLFIFHPKTEPAWLNIQKKITELTSEEIRRLRFVNMDLIPTEIPVYTLDEALEFLRGRCYINLDKSWTCLAELMATIRRHKIEEQIILKSAPKEKYLRAVEELAPDIKYMPIFNETDEAASFIESMGLRFYGAELLFASDDSQFAQDDYIKKIHKKGKKLWVNAIVYDYTRVLAAGHSDDVSLTGDPESGWGWLIDKGYDIIQTDWPLMLLDFMQKRNKAKTDK